MHSDGSEFIMIISYSLFNDVLYLFVSVDVFASRFHFQMLFHHLFFCDKYIFFIALLFVMLMLLKENENEMGRKKFRK